MHHCPVFLAELAKPDGLITVHRARITTLEKSSVRLSNGDALPCHAVIYAIGWDCMDELFSPELANSLGLAKPLHSQDEGARMYWEELQRKADEEIVKELPILKQSPGLSKGCTQTPFRLYRQILPSTLAAEGDRSLVILGCMSSIATHIWSEVSALWAISWLEDLIDLGVPTDKAELDYDIARVNAYWTRNTLSVEPAGGGEIQLIVDKLMKDMGLKVKRKSGFLGIRDVFVPYRSQDYLGIVDEVLKKSNRQNICRDPQA